MGVATETFSCRGAGGDGFTLPGAGPSYAPDLALEPVHTRVELAFDLEAATAKGSVTHTVRANRAGARSLRLDAVAIEVEGVRGPEWRYDGKGIDLAWKTPFAAGEERTVEVRYSVRDPVTGMRFSRPDEAYPSRPLFVATDHETERARYWLPCVDYPAVRTTFEFVLTARKELTILANGVLVSETANRDGTKTAHWKLDHRCPSYLCCLAVGRFVRHDDETVDGRPVAYFGTERFTPAHLARTFGRTPAMLRWIQEKLKSPFPYPKYFQIAVPEIGGAMENISLVTWDDSAVLDEAVASETQLQVDSVNIHEMAHSYFGDAIVCRHFEHSWLKESWATYVETVWREDTLGRDERDYDLHTSARKYMREADERYARPIVTRTYSSSWDLFDAHLYPGGAWRIHMLRHLVGEEPFWAAVRDYVATYRDRLVETDDFRRKLEEHSGLNLTRFFDQWIHAPGYPKLKVAFQHDAAKGEGRLTVEQKQKDEKKGIGLFSFALEVAWTDDAGAHTVTVPVGEERHVVSFPVKGKPKDLRFDPERKALFAIEGNPGDDLLKGVLSGAPDIASRIWAAEELVKTGTRANLRAVGDAMAKEPFWGVRAAVADAFGKSRSGEAAAPLAAMLLAEADPRAKRTVAAACGGWRDPRLRDALVAFLGTPQPPFARGAALTALGAQRDDRDLALLDRESRVDGIHRLVAAGALRGLGAHRSAAASDALRARLPYGAEPEPSRPAAVEAFGASARLLERAPRERARDALVDLTRDRNERVRLRAAEALAALGDAAVAPALEAMKARHSNQDEPKIERLIASLRKGAAGEEAQKLQEQVEKLEARVRKLDERIQDLESKG